MTEARKKKTISLRQQWASPWCSERKLHETRHWPTSHRGWRIGLHAQRLTGYKIASLPPD
jgi:hypothetical protein